MFSLQRNRIEKWPSLKESCELFRLEESELELANLLKKCTIRDDFGSLLENPKFSDVVLVACDEREFPAHKCVLVARSSVFSAMFDQDMAETQSGVVNIDDLDGDILCQLLNYIYTGRLIKDTEWTILQQLMMAADKYDIGSMKASCEYSLVKQLSAENVVDLLLCADACGASILKLRAVEFMKMHRETAQAPKFRDIELSHPKLAFEVLRQMLNL